MANSEDSEVYRIEDPASPIVPDSSASAHPSSPSTANALPADDVPFGNYPPRRSSSRKGLWAAIIVLAVIIIAGGTWLFLSRSSQSEEVATADTITQRSNAAEVVHNETTNAPAEVATTETDTATTKEEEMEKPSFTTFAGSLTNSETGSYVSVGINITFEGSGSVQGVSENGELNYSVSGSYNSETHRLLIHEDGGGNFDGTIQEDGSYAGQYHDVSGTPLSFHLRLLQAEE